MKTLSLFSRSLPVVVVVLWATIGFLSIYFSPVLQGLELQVQPTFFRLRGQQLPPDNVIILAIDELSLSQGSFYNPKTTPYLEPIQQYPWQRVAYAKAIDRIIKAGAKVVAVDVLFVQPSIYGQSDDQAFEKILLTYQNQLVLAASEERSESQEGLFEHRMSPVDIFPTLSRQVEGFVGLTPERDRSIRRFAETEPTENSFAQATLDRAGIAYTAPQESLINYFGKAGTWRRVGQEYPFYFVLDPQNWQGALQNGKVFENKIVLIGATASSLQDIQLTPVGEMPGVEIHANALSTLLTDRAIHVVFPQKSRQGIFVGLWVCLIGFLLSKVPKPQEQFLVAVTTSAVWAVCGFLLWQFRFLLFPISPLITTAWGMGISFLVLGVFKEQIARSKLEAEKEKIRKTLELYVAAPIVAEIMKQPETYYTIVTGKTIPAVVMFADIRRFTSISLLIPPQVLIPQLNVYFEHMVEEIVAHQGTVDKFIGDAIMAEFGSPLPRGAEVDLMSAIQAALGMRRALHHLRQKWIQEGKEPFFQGIGLHFGEVIVGNIGSPRRLEYAVIGDTVNVASRVEGLTKPLGCDILLTESIYEIVKTKIDVVDLGEHELRGRLGGLRIYGLIALKGESPSLYSQVQRDWEKYQQHTKKMGQY